MPGATNKINAYVNDVIHHDGAFVVNQMLADNMADRTIATYITHIRNNAFTNPDTVPTEYNEAMKQLYSIKIDDEEDAAIRRDFLAMTRKQQNVCLRKTHGKPFKSKVLNKIVNVRLLHQNFDNLVMPHSVRQRIDTSDSKRVEKKNCNLTEISNYQADINSAICMLVNFNMGTNVTNYKIINALLMLSGRRFSEVATFASIFEPTNHPNVVLFRGQLKTDDKIIYPIHLLCNSQVFINAYERLKECIGTLTIKKAEERYNYICNKHLRQDLVRENVKFTCHCLRGMYFSAIYQSFGYDTRMAYQYFIKSAAGHANQITACNYTQFRVTGVDDIADYRIYGA